MKNTASQHERRKRKTMKVKLKNVRASYPDLFEARPFDDSNPNSDRSYKIDIRIPKTDTLQIKAITDTMIAATKEQYADKAAAMYKMFKADSKNFPLKDGDEFLNKQGEPVAPGFYILRAKRKEADGAPGVFDNKAGPDGKPAKLTAESGRIYAGCYVNASVDIWAQKGKYQGVRCTLLGVQFAKDGEAFSGSRPASSDDFESLVDEAEMASANAADDFSDI